MAFIAPADLASTGSSWSSAGLRRREAIREWQDWAARTIAPVDVNVRETGSFAARWRSHGLGPLTFLELFAPAQRVVHRGADAHAGSAAPSIQLVYVRRGAVRTQIGGRSFVVHPGEFVLFDNTRFYQMDMEGPHQALDLIMPRSWLERWLSDPERLLARPVSSRSHWGRPLGSLLEATAGGISERLPFGPMIAEQLGGLLMLAAGIDEAAPGRHRGQLAQAILRRIESGFADPELTSERVCRALGISKRYLQAVLAARGTSFVRELTAVRLERASLLLADPRQSGLAVGDVAFRCGFLDAGYFTRQFRARYSVTPREWRQRPNQD